MTAESKHSHANGKGRLRRLIEHKTVSDDSLAIHGNGVELAEDCER
jgi:hypothetical protein